MTIYGGVGSARALVRMGTAPAGVRGELIGGGKRRECQGWTQGATARLKALLASVDFDELTKTHELFGVTVTFRDCPETARDCKRVWNAWIRRLKRRFGPIAYVWVMEWQERGVPHYHVLLAIPKKAMIVDSVCSVTGRVFYAMGPVREAVLGSWLKASRRYGTQAIGQDMEGVRSLSDFQGYLVKHVFRSVDHYQRDREHMPSGWDGAPGRVWGRSRNLVLIEAVRVELGPGAYLRASRALVRVVGKQLGHLVANKKRRDWSAEKLTAYLVKTRTVAWKGLSVWLTPQDSLEFWRAINA